MQDSQKSTAAPQQIGVLLFDQFSNHCLANTVEPLRAANVLARRDLYRLQYLTIDGAVVTSSSGLPVLPDMRLAEHSGGDILFVLPSYGYLDYVQPQLLRGLRSASRRFSMIAGLDTGSWLMAETGLLDGYRATIHWDEIDSFAERFPMVNTSNARVVVDRNRASCGGATTAFELVLAQIGTTHGAVLKSEVSALFMHGERTAEKAPPTGSALVDAALALMRRNQENLLSIPEIAGQLGCTHRRLETHFSRQMRQTPSAAYRHIRLLSARRILEQTGHSVAETALRCGYSDASAMTRAYRLEFGETPSSTRTKAQLARSVPGTGASN